MIPSNYSEWYECITIKCKIPMTQEFIKSRLAALTNSTLPETKKFTSLYGVEHLNRVISWFEEAKKGSK